jgi:hypothetical protein
VDEALEEIEATMPDIVTDPKQLRAVARDLLGNLTAEESRQLDERSRELRREQDAKRASAGRRSASARTIALAVFAAVALAAVALAASMASNAANQSQRADEAVADLAAQRATPVTIDRNTVHQALPQRVSARVEASCKGATCPVVGKVAVTVATECTEPMACMVDISLGSGADELFRGPEPLHFHDEKWSTTSLEPIDVDQAFFVCDGKAVPGSWTVAIVSVAAERLVTADLWSSTKGRVAVEMRTNEASSCYPTGTIQRFEMSY